MFEKKISTGKCNEFQNVHHISVMDIWQAKVADTLKLTCTSL